MVKVNLGLSQFLNKVFLSKNMQLEFTKCTFQLQLREAIMTIQNVTLSKQYIGIKKYKNGTKI